MAVDYLPDPGQGEAVVARVCVSDTARRNHAALAHAEAADDGQTEDGERRLFRHDLQEVGGPGLAEVGVDNAGNVDDGVGGDELEEPAEETAEARGHDNGAGGSYGGVAAFFREMEGRVVARHGPDYGDEGHEDRDTGRKICAVVDGAPDLG